MRLRLPAALALLLVLCGLFLFGASRWRSGGSRRAQALELETPRSVGGGTRAVSPLGKVAGGGESLLAESSLDEEDQVPTAANREAINGPKNTLSVFVRAQDSDVELSGAEVRAISRFHQQAFEEVSGEEGLAEFELPADAERVDLVVSAAGYVTAHVSSIDWRSGEHTQPMVSAATIEGNVRLDGAPGARVHLWSLALQQFIRQGDGGGEVGDDRSFRFEGLSPGGYSLGLELEGRGIDFVANVELGPGDTETLSLSAPRPGELDLKIVRPGEAQEPVPGASVKLIPDRQGVPRALERGVGQRRGETDEQGRWRVAGLSPGEWLVDVSDGVAKTLRRVDVEQGGRISKVSVELRAAPSLIVRLKGGGTADPSSLYVFAEAKGESNGDRKAELRPDGTYFFEGLPPSQRLRIRAGVKIGSWAGDEESRPTRTAFVNLKPRDKPYELELNLTAQCEATVVAMKPDGTPWKLGVTLGGQNPTRFIEPGTYGFTLPAGPAIMEAGGSDGYGKNSTRVAIEPGEENRFEVTLRAATEISGSFSDSNGAALIRLRVRARRQNVEKGQKRDFMTRTDAFGAFRFGNLPDGEFILSAVTRYGQMDAESAQAEFSSPRDSGAFFPLVLPYLEREPMAVGSIIGRAVGPDGERVSRFRVENLRRGTVSVDGDRFEIRDMRAGRFNLTLVADGCLPQVLRSVDLPAGATIDLGTLDFLPSTRVIVDVRGPDNKRLTEVRIELRTRQADLTPGQKPARHRIRDRRRDGRYQREKSPRGRFQLIVRRDGYKTYRRNVTVRNQRQQSFRMKLQKQDPND